MRRRLVIAAVMVAFLVVAALVNPPAEAQIGLGRNLAGTTTGDITFGTGDLLLFTSDGSLSAPNIASAADTGNGFFVGASQAGMVVGNSNPILVMSEPSAIAHGLDLTWNPAGLDGNDSVAGFGIDTSIGNFTGTGNTANIIEIEDLAGDANISLNAINIGALTDTVGSANEVESAINLGVGWDYTFHGAVTTTAFRDEFTYQCTLFNEDGSSVASVTDAGQNEANCREAVSSTSKYHYRLDGDQASPFVISAGHLDIDNDAGASEGVNIVFADDPQDLYAWEFGTAYYFRIKLAVADVSDLAVFHFGWRLNEDYIDQAVLATQNTYAAFSIPAGTASATAATNGTDQTELAPSCDLSDNEIAVFEIRVSATGVPTYYCGATEAALALLTTGTAIGPFETPDIMVPYIAYIGTAGTTETTIDFIEIGVQTPVG